MISDAFYSIGKSHIVCQDYAIARSYDRSEDCPQVCAAVADGCSSSKDTDVGARYLAISAIEEVKREKYCIAIDSHERNIIRRARHLVPIIMDIDCLDSTLLIAYLGESGMIRVKAFGDGVVLARRKDGMTETWEIDFGNIPFYLNYLISPRRLEAFRKEASRRGVTYSINGEVLNICDIDIADDPLAPTPWMRQDFSFDPLVYDLVMLLTDGVQSFRSSSTHESIPLKDIIPYLVDIRVRTKGFLTRSHRFFLTKTCEKLGWYHFDDFGSAAILLNEE